MHDRARLESLAAVLGHSHAHALLAAFSAPPEGAKGDLDPEGRWVTVSGQHIHIDGAGRIDAGGHPELRKVLADKAGLVAKGDAGKAGPAKVAVVGDEAEVRGHFQAVFGGKVPFSALAALAGAPDGSQVSVRKDDYRLAVEITHPDFDAKRSFLTDDDGRASIINDEFYMKPGAGGKGTGTAVFASQAQAAAAAGVATINCAALKSPTANGYYTWPRLGYDQPLDDLEGELGPKKAKAMRALFPEAESVLDLFQSKAGRDWWKANGVTMDNAVFDLSAGSRSRAVLDAYVAEKAKGAGPAKPEPKPEPKPEAKPEAKAGPAAHKLKKYNDGEYEYRGHNVYRPGAAPAWRISGKHFDKPFASLDAAIKAIDARLEAAAAPAKGGKAQMSATARPRKPLGVEEIILSPEEEDALERAWESLERAGFAGDAGAKGDLDPEGRWVTIQGQHIHIDSGGGIDAGGHPELRKVLAEKAGLPASGGQAAAPAAPAQPMSAAAVKEALAKAAPVFTMPQAYLGEGMAKAAREAVHPLRDAFDWMPLPARLLGCPPVMLTRTDNASYAMDRIWLDPESMSHERLQWVFHHEYGHSVADKTGLHLSPGFQQAMKASIERAKGVEPEALALKDHHTWEMADQFLRALKGDWYKPDEPGYMAKAGVHAHEVFATAFTLLVQYNPKAWKAFPEMKQFMESHLGDDAPPLVPAKAAAKGAGFSGGETGAKGDLDPAGHWVTIQGQHVHITGAGEIDAGGHPELRKVLADKAGLHPRGEGPAEAKPAAPAFAVRPPRTPAKASLAWAAGEIITRKHDAVVLHLLTPRLAQYLADANCKLAPDAKGGHTAIGVTKHGDVGPVVNWQEGDVTVALHELGHAINYPAKHGEGFVSSELVKDQAKSIQDVVGNAASLEYLKAKGVEPVITQWGDIQAGKGDPDKGMLYLDYTSNHEMWADLVSAYHNPRKHLMLREALPETHARLKEVFGQSPFDVPTTPALSALLADVAKNGWLKGSRASAFGLSTPEGEKLVMGIAPPVYDKKFTKAELGRYPAAVAAAEKTLAEALAAKAAKEAGQAPGVPPDAPAAAAKAAKPVPAIGVSDKLLNGKPVVEIAVAEDPGSKIRARVKGGTLRIERSDVTGAHQGKGWGSALYAAAADHAAKSGLDLASHETVSADAARAWDALKRRGYQVEVEPTAQKNAAGDWVSGLDANWVFRIRHPAQAGFSHGVPPRPGLVPQSGDPMHPRHWVRPDEPEAPASAQPSAQPPLAPEAPASPTAPQAPAGPPAPAPYAPDPAARNAATGLADRARVGVPAMEVPPPPGIGRLPNLGRKARAVESAYAAAYAAAPDEMAAKYLKALRKRKVGEYPNVFATDDVKALNADWNPDGPQGPGAKLSGEAKAAMAKYNAAVHQTANAVAKRAFLAYLDDVVAHLPPGRRTVLVTNGGCAAGKGSSLAKSGQEGSTHHGMLPPAAQVGAVWDAAGEQNATENEWVLQECRKRGIKAAFAYVWAEPKDTWDGEGRGVIRRAMRKGRMVDARLFADSYAVGARNMKDFHEKHKGDADASFIFIDNRDKGAPKLLDAFPDATLKWDAEAIYRDALEALEKRKGDLSEELYNAGKSGTWIWGPPKPKPAQAAA